MTTAASKSQSGGPSTSKNCALLATDGATRSHSILQGCRAMHNSSVSPPWCRATPVRATFNFRRCQSVSSVKEKEASKLKYNEKMLKFSEISRRPTAPNWSCSRLSRRRTYRDVPHRTSRKEDDPDSSRPIRVVGNYVSLRIVVRRIQ